MIKKLFLIFTLFLPLFLHCKDFEPKVLTGIDLFLSKEYFHILKGKKIGIVANHTSVNYLGQSTISLLKQNQKNGSYKVVALFAPEHGILGSKHAEEYILDSFDADQIPIHSLHGKTKRPTQKMLQGIDAIVFDIQDLGSRSYTYTNTLFLVMEEAAKNNLEVIVLDRPNPINGIIVDGPMMEEKLRSFVGYINVPYCHGMTIGELANFFNTEYKIGCRLKVIPMKGWKRSMTFQDTGLPWIPTSPNIPEKTTAIYYPTTGIMGEISLVNIGIGYTLPFKVVGAPWIDADNFAKNLNEQKFPGVIFHSFHFKPFFGLYAKEECNGVLILVNDLKTFKPVSTEYLILGMLKTLYPDNFQKAIQKAERRKEMFNKINGTEEAWRIIKEEKFITWKLLSLHQEERKQFLTKRKKYLIQNY